MPEFFSNPTLRTVALGAALLGAVSGALGSFALLRRQSLLGDAVSHAALPGVVLAFLLTGNKAPLTLLIGATLAGWLAALAVIGIVRASRIPFDSALAGVLAVFFGVGVMLLTYLQKGGARASQAGLDRFLFGQAATLLSEDLWAMAGVGVLALAVLLVFWKEFKLLCFDPGYAASLGLPVRLLDGLLTGLMVLAIVIGLQAVGVVLMSAMLVAPAAAARQWTDRLGRMVALGALFGAAAGAGGTVLSDALSGARKVPTGPAIVLCATVWVVLSLAAARLRRGAVS